MQKTTRSIWKNGRICYKIHVLKGKKIGKQLNNTPQLISLY